MCGVCGYLRLGDGPPAERGLIDRMTDVLAHRGPDDRGIWSDGRVWLGSRRLAVIDLSSAGRQPMESEDGAVHIIYNGEVYNFQTLKTRHRLEERGHRFCSRTDTEVLLHLYEELGTAMFAELNGMFAIAIWDSRDGRLHLARDRFGIKPLFYRRDSGSFRFASEIKSILVDPSIPRRASRQALHDYLTFDYVPGPQTAFEEIYEVPPAHRMTLDAEGRIELERYWDIEYDIDPGMDEASATRRVRELLETAVQRRLIADVPIGVLLSGGMDSSACVALMKQFTGERVHTYSVGFEDPSFDERSDARLVAERFDTVHREVVVTPDTVRSLLSTTISFIDEPYADGSAIPTWCVSELASDEVVVVLSGEGADEIFAGYDTYAAHKAASWFRRIPGPVRRGLIPKLVRALPVSDRKLSLDFKAKRFVGGQDLSPEEAHAWWRIVLTEERKSAIYGPAMRDGPALQSPIRHFREAYARSTATDSLDRLMYVDTSVFLPDDLMVKNDRMTMAHSLEARVPMTDPELVSFLATVPPRLKMPRLRKKHIMKLALADLLPDEILKKKKVGLEMPYSRWLRDELRDLLDSYLAPDRLEGTGLFRPEGVGALVTEHMERRVDHGRALWGLLNFMVWYDLYIE